METNKSFINKRYSVKVKIKNNVALTVYLKTNHDLFHDLSMNIIHRFGYISLRSRLSENIKSEINEKNL